MKLTKDDVLRTANLAKLKVTDEEIASSKTDMQEFLVFSKQLDELNTQNVTPTVSPLSFCNALREDIAGLSLEKEDVLGNTQTRDENGFIVPRVVE